MNGVVQAMAKVEVDLMVNDVTGKMGHAVATAAVAAGINLVPYCLTGPAREPEEICGTMMTFIDSTQDRDALMVKAKEEFPNLIVVDYTVPMCVNANAELYIKHMIPFVMGTTGGDRDKLVCQCFAYQ